MQPIYSLLASLAVLAIGPLAAWLVPKSLKSSRILQLLLVGCVLVFIGLEVANHAQHIDFASFIILMIVSALLTGWLESFIARRLKKTANDGPQTFTMIAIVAGMAAHAIMDGVVLKESYFYLPMAIIVHRIPASLLIWQVLAEKGRPMLAMALLALIGAGTLVGYYGAQQLLPNHDTFQYVQAIVVGALLHLAFHRDGDHDDEPKAKAKRPSRARGA